MKKWCLVEWCQEYLKSKNYCLLHRNRFKKHWDPLVVKKRECGLFSKHKLSVTYSGMKQRCYNPKSESYKNYWWRWIIICDRRLWKKWFINFLEDMWERPEWTTIDRINNNWNYEPWNCRWANVYTQSSNKNNNNKKVWVSYYGWWYVSRLFYKWKDTELKCFKNYEEAVNHRKYLENKYLKNFL